jgi:hypothetical protein
MYNYSCYYCAFGADSLQDIINHLITEHAQQEISYRELVQTPVLGFRRKICQGVIPQKVSESGKKIVVTDDCGITLIEDHSDNTPHARKKRLSAVSSPEQSHNLRKELFPPVP